MSSREEASDAIAKTQTSDSDIRYDTYDDVNEPPAVRKLWKRIRVFFVLNIMLAFAAAFQAYFAYRSTELTRIAIAESATQHAELLAKSKELNDAVVAEAKASRELSEHVNAATIKEAQASTRLTAAALEAAREANANSREAFRLDQRPWLLLRGASLSFPDTDGLLRAEVIWSNVGNSPAMAVKFATSSVTLQPPGLQKPGQIPGKVTGLGIGGASPIQSPPDPMHNTNIVGPSVEHPLRFSLQLTKEQMVALTRGVLSVYIQGAVSYEDVFKQSHETTFCLVSDDPTPRPSNAAQRLMEPCITGNVAK